MLQIQDLRKTYPGGVRALAGVSFDVEPGLFGLLGPNGAGKSTLMRTLATLQEPDDGRVLLDGRETFADPRAHRRRLGYLPQEMGVYPGISALDLLDHLALLKGIGSAVARREQVEAMLERTNLWAHRRRAVSTFSGGMRRRFGIAQALLGDPRLLIVDEPTAGLDPEERRRFHDLLAEVGERVIVLLSTHIVADVAELCSRVAILAGGQLVTIGRPDDLAAALAGRLWRRTVERSTLGQARRDHTVLGTRLRGGRVELVVIADERPGDGFEPHPPTLEDAYFAALPDLAS